MAKLSYRKSGVDINKANLFIDKIKPLVLSTKRSGWVSNIGAFSGLFKPDLKKYKNPILVSSTDGVGTKLIVAGLAGKHDTVGIDLVAMSVNDLITCGAEPLFFLDYLGTGVLNSQVSYEIVKGIAAGCRESNCALLGGETAELPGMYPAGEYDLAGFAVGIVDKKKIIDGRNIEKGDLILGLESSGLHSNGFSLVRKIFSKKELKKRAIYGEVLKPTRIYVRPILDIIKRFRIKAISHITGGGFYDNITRLLPAGKRAVIYNGTWPVNPIFTLLQKKGGVKEIEMFRTFNMGIGMALVMPRKEIVKTQEYLHRKHSLNSWIIGEVIKGTRGVEIL